MIGTFQWVTSIPNKNLLRLNVSYEISQTDSLSLPRPGDRPRLVSSAEVSTYSTISVFVEATVEESVFQAADTTGRSRQALVLSNRAVAGRPLQPRFASLIGRRRVVLCWIALGMRPLDFPKSVEGLRRDAGAIVVQRPVPVRRTGRVRWSGRIGRLPWSRNDGRMLE